MTERPLVTVLIPARNESRDIEECLHAVQQQDYPHDRLEIVVVDGDSSDATVEVAEKRLAQGDVRSTVVVNPAATTPSNLNVGLARAAGSVLCRVDARSIVPIDYVSRCVELLGSRSDVVVVGGAQVARARSGDATSLGIARALNNRWGMGLSRYRRGAASGPADTVYLGAFRTEQLRDVGGWDEAFPTNQDFELNRRMRELGAVWFDASLEVGYRPRPSLVTLARQYHRFGAWKARYWTTTGDRPRPRQVVLLALPLAGLFAFAALALLPRPWRRLATAAAATGAVVFEVRGPTGPPAPLRAHAVSLVASAAVGAGWTTGAWQTLLSRGRGRGRRAVEGARD
jgi:glycosyltransferase involved in cell wall biosynthesis